LKRDLFLSRLEEGVIVADGAIGTTLLQKGLAETKCKEEVNISDPAMMEEIHGDFIRAGAQIIRTNTLRANAFHLKEYNLEGRVREINTLAVRAAKKANRMGQAFVAASIGPLSALLKPYGEYEISDIETPLEEQIKILSECEPDLFFLDSQVSFLEAKKAINLILKHAPGIPVIASFSFSKEGRTYFGDEMTDTLKKAVSLGADAVGLNCSLGPNDMAELVEMVCRRFVFPLSVMPNAGYPAMVKGKRHYLSTPEYMAEYSKEFLDLGVNIIGGCCGTTPAHIKKIAETVKSKHPAKRVMEDSGEISIQPSQKTSPVAASEKGFFKKLGKEFVISVEIDPPKSADCSQALRAAKVLKNAGVDAVNIAENPLAKVRISPMVAAHIIRSETGLTTVLHLTCRDRNLLGIQSDLLGASALGIEGILALRGDPTTAGDFPSATSVNDVTSVGLVKIIRSLNNGLDFADNPVDPPTNFRIGVGVNSNSSSPEEEINRLKEKINAGAEFGVTQPVFDIRRYKEFYGSLSELGIPVITGILPLRSLKHALFLKNEVAGIEIGDDIIERIRKHDSKEDQAKCGLEIAREILDEIRTFSRGAYIMPPFSKYEVVLDLLS
jgi:methionine synthase / methylenetetrahydrofolate reductase(NADPH)